MWVGGPRASASIINDLCHLSSHRLWRQERRCDPTGNRKPPAGDLRRLVRQRLRWGRSTERRQEEEKVTHQLWAGSICWTSAAN